MRSIHDILKQHWGYDQFRPLQEEIIQSVVGGYDTLALLPTGGGKSICFQVAGLARGGLTLVVSPLIALMKDQVENLIQRGIRATFINSSLPSNENERRIQDAINGQYDFLYCSPERLQTVSLQERLPLLNIHTLAIDEAHCISQWGYDFRPAYLQITEIRKLLPGVPVIALTATATPTVQQDIIEKLKLSTAKQFTKSFVRENLRYVVLYEENRYQKMLEILRKIHGSGVIYVRSRKATETIADQLLSAGISAAPYHGGMNTQQRNSVQQQWLDNRIRIMVATNAFGMGIDKPDVRIVIHIDLPPDLESYYQEA
ncbi:MAG: ATP-dependent DNA helicase, partial [Bacteroidia bacterium]|nr:ATP-dependent DNA helicase [Bacteroidia bacterium]